MALDGLTLSALRHELRAILVGNRIQKIVQVDAVSVALEMYGNHRRTWLVLSADPQQPKVYLASARPGRGVETPSPLLLLLRKYVEGLAIVDIDQPPGERVLVFSVGGRVGPVADETEAGQQLPRRSFRLIIEAISQYSNLILVDDAGVVVDAIRRVTAEQNRTRVTLPRHPYIPPPGQPKRPLRTADTVACRSILEAASATGSVWQALVSSFAGLGPLAAREITFRATGDAKARIPDANGRDRIAEKIANALASIVEPVWSGAFPTTVALAPPTSNANVPDANVRPDETVVDFAPYELTHVARWEPRPSLSAAAEEFYRQTRGIRAVDVARAAVKTAIAAERVLADKKRDSLLRALESTTKADSWRAQGELLLAYSNAIPRGAASFHVDGVVLELDPRLTAVEYAQSIFRRYRKAKSALREVPTLLQDVESRLRYLDEVAALADIADTSDALRALRADIRPGRERPGRPVKRRRASRTDEGVLRMRTSSNHEFLVGRTALQNNAVTFDLGRPDDVWLHARGCPGAHVILRVDSAEPATKDLLEAARVAAYFSANRESAKVTVDWTRRKSVRRIAKSTPGLVTYSGEKSLVVQPSRAPIDDEN